MKRIKIWLKSFSLLQQLIAIVFLSFAILIMFSLFFLQRNIDNFINNQMYDYLHRYQSQYMVTTEFNSDMIYHYVYNRNTKNFLNRIQPEYQEILDHLDLNKDFQTVYDGIYQDTKTYTYSIIEFNKDYLLISFVKPEFRSEVESALFSGVVGITLYVVVAIIFLIIIWVASLIHPINLMKNYVSNIKNNKDATLQIDRKDEIGSLAEALVDMNNELSQQKHIRDEMVQNISHDLKTPIATIKSYSESIKDGIYPYDTLEKSVDVILDNANRLEKKVYSLLTFNKMEYLKNENPMVLNLRMAPIVEKAILDAKVIRNDITIETDLDEDAFFRGDEEPWLVVIENILDNGLRYAKSEIKITLFENWLEIYNDGPQMEPERLEKLFTAYEMGNKGKFGLGLSIVKKVCNTYGYTVTGENMNDGVVFRIIANKKMKKPSKKQIKKEA